jgi:polynucleotide 5'-hydroxyl-kinase GRC3/NOL9
MMVIGASDTGKSSLACYLYRELCRQGICVAYLDTDVGQSTLGLPTTLNVALAAEPGDAQFPPEGLRVAYFVGATSPRRHMLPAVVGAFQLQRKALALGAEAIVVDTTGWVDQAEGGKALKQWKVELLRPGTVIGLQRARELESILWPLRHEDRVRTLELPVSQHAIVRSRDTRIARRRDLLARYFRNAQLQLVVLQRQAVYDLERMAIGAILAFQDASGFTLALGIVEEIDQLGGGVIVRTPLVSLGDARSVRFGSTRWDLINQREL